MCLVGIGKLEAILTSCHSRPIAPIKLQVRPDHSYSDVKDILETWRLRLPNEWDPLLHWQDVLVWRNTVYNVVISVSRFDRGLTRFDWAMAGILLQNTLHMYLNTCTTHMTISKLLTGIQVPPHMHRMGLPPPQHTDTLSTHTQMHTTQHNYLQAFNKIQVPPHMHQMGYRDKAWSVNRLGTIAAK